MGIVERPGVGPGTKEQDGQAGQVDRKTTHETIKQYRDRRHPSTASCATEPAARSAVGPGGVNVEPLSPLFSLIVPTLNVAATLRSCLSSIAEQTFTDFEVVVVDGGSIDETPAILASFAATLGDRLTLLRGEDDGVYPAMNRGVGHARGEWLLFLGADDTLAAGDTLAEVAAFLRGAGPVDLVYGDVVLRSSSARDGGAFDLDRLLFERNLCHQAVCYRRALFATIGPYNPRYRIWADWDFNIRCFANPALVTRHMDIVVANYNDTGGLSMQEDSELKRRLPVFLLPPAHEPTFGEKLADLASKMLPGRDRRGR
jgi:glycosyltransferase involved in cell wall biosynthesis